MVVRPKISSRVESSNVPLRSRGSGFGGICATEDANVSLHIDGDLEGAMLKRPGESILDVGSGTICWYKHSSSDSLLVTGHGLWVVDPDGIALDKRYIRSMNGADSV
jgi:hypothetical protein